MAFLTFNRLRRLARRAARGGLVWLAFAACLPLGRAADGPAPAPAVLSAEYRVKAGFLFTFPQFVEWPARVFPEAQSPIVIGILGEDPFGSYLDEIVQGEKIGERSIVVRRFARIEDVADCHILFLGRSVTGSLEKILARLRDRRVLTVGEDETFERAGGMVRFVIENNKVRLRINRAAAEAHELAISSKLLRLATLVSPAKN
jgi:hypothetical protein